MKLNWIFIVLFGLSCHAYSAEKEFYKWVDEHGTTHYSATKPAHVKATVIKLSDVRGQLEPVTEKKKPEPKLPKAYAPKKQVNNKDAAKCEQVRQDILKLQSSPRIRIINEETGEARYLTPEELEVRLKKSLEQEKEFCDD